MNSRLISRRVASITQCTSFSSTLPALSVAARPRSLHTETRRNISQTSRTSSTATLEPSVPQINTNVTRDRPLSRISTINLLRSLLLGYTFSSPRLLKSSIWLMNMVVNSRWAILHPDKNPVVAAVLRAFIYDHFCAGTTPDAVRKSVEHTKSLGYSGIILGFSREILAEEVVGGSTADVEKQAIQSWMEGNLNSLKLIGKGDHTNLK